MTAKWHAELCIDEGRPIFFTHHGHGLTDGYLTGDTACVLYADESKTTYYIQAKTGDRYTGKLGPIDDIEIQVDGCWKIEDLIPYWSGDDLTADDIRAMVRKAKEAKEVKK